MCLPWLVNSGWLTPLSGSFSSKSTVTMFPKWPSNEYLISNKKKSRCHDKKPVVHFTTGPPFGNKRDLLVASYHSHIAIELKNSPKYSTKSHLNGKEVMFWIKHFNAIIYLQLTQDKRFWAREIGVVCKSRCNLRLSILFRVGNHLEDRQIHAFTKKGIVL